MWPTHCRAVRSPAPHRGRRASSQATRCAPKIFTRRLTRACRATRAARPASSRPSAAVMSIPTRLRSAKVKTQNGSTRCCSTAANCGARRAILRSKFRSRRSSRIWSTREMTDAAAQRATQEVRSIPRTAEGPVFREPWEAQAFALALSLNERGLFTWKEWAATLGDEIKKAQAAGDPDTGETYYHHWLATLERIVAEKGLSDSGTLARTRDAWERACERTPHGTPIELRPDDFRGA